jgi:hypothetical protein
VLHAHLRICARGLSRRRTGRKDWQWWRRQRQRTGKQYKSPLSPNIPSRWRNVGSHVAQGEEAAAH